jgi:hypothetical protein
VSYMLLVMADGSTSATQPTLIAGCDPMALIALLLIAVVVWYLMQCVNVKGYTCKECDYWTPDRQDAAGHQHLHSLHKFDL